MFADLRKYRVIIPPEEHSNIAYPGPLEEGGRVIVSSLVRPAGIKKRDDRKKERRDPPGVGCRTRAVPLRERSYRARK